MIQVTQQKPNYLLLFIISIIIIIAIWMSKFSRKAKIWYTIIYVIIGGAIYYYMARNPKQTIVTTGSVTK